MERIETKSHLKDLLCEIMTKINEQKINKDNVIVLLLSKEPTVETPIAKPSYYSEKDTEIIQGMISRIRSGETSLRELPGQTNLRECAKCEGKDFGIQCLLIAETVNYFGVIQYILDKIGKRGCYRELKDGKNLRRLSADLELPNRMILMERYAQQFLKREGLPAAEFLIELSAQKYEGSESEARIYIEDRQIEESHKVCFFDKIGEQERVLESGKLRTIRKLMEMSKRKAVYLLASENLHIMGMISFKAEEEEKINQRNRYISFNGYMRWSIYVAGKEEICYRQGQYYINSSGGRDAYMVEVEKFKQRVIEKAENIPVMMIEELVSILCKQKHGTTVILTDNVTEAQRLCEVDRGILIDSDNIQNFKARNKFFDQEKILSVTEIDGALFMDLNGKCTAFGVIVDGKASKRGNSGRGARYNSVYNYIHQKEEDKVYVALIFSEDGGVKIEDNFDEREKFRK